MKPRLVIYLLILALIILAVVFVRRPSQHPTAPEPTPTVQTTDNIPAIPVATANVVSQAIPSPRPTAANSPAVPTQADDQRRRLQEYQRAANEANVPIDFHGLVIDQDSNALSGVDIKVVARHWIAPTPSLPEIISKSIQIERKSDANGRFEINGATGDAFDLESIEKLGYEAELTRRSYGATEGNVADPVIFRMWNTNIHEHLISGHKNFDIVPDGRPYLIDLTRGTIAESGMGDLKVWVKRPEHITYGQRYDWSCEVGVVSGGLQVPPANSSLFLAPADGYTPSFHFDQEIGSGWGDTTGPKRFFITVNNSREYGSITIELYAYYNPQTPGLVSLSYTINPSGSRILR